MQPLSIYCYKKNRPKCHVLSGIVDTEFLSLSAFYIKVHQKVGFEWSLAKSISGWKIKITSCTAFSQPFQHKSKSSCQLKKYLEAGLFVDLNSMAKTNCIKYF